jgi:hypothetical protein
MKRLVRWLPLALLLVALIAVAAPVVTAQTPVAQAPVTLAVYDPTGAFEVTQLFAPRIADLNGATVCEVSDNLWETARTFPLVRGLLQKQFPTIKIIPYDKMPEATTDAASKIGETLKKAGCQAAIVGNAG